MIILFLFFMFVILSCDSAKDHNISNPICPESFNCTGLAQFKYPFYNVTDTRCGLIKVNCTTKGAVVELGGRSYEIINKFDSDSSFVIRNRTFEELIEAKSCEALNNFTSPIPLLFSISIAPYITLFKCTKKNLSYTQQMDAYFKQPTYNSYNLCKDHNFYYNYSLFSQQWNSSK
ncbi:putative LEAF RUST 10 DISEASE-RESISTANCE LOCUS RECEPTOR-LIKE PROTEIN KINASE-like 1.1/1.2/1.3/1.4 [Helianthus annuus]|nr:putative LEAF RUST 10 DISEASE-RESISTANCE LOCUS RECEPTOR-LIKE PROTEIN KINASE-like 1.1/1.2/1.3/1.4 [Helianthus annuus]